MGDSISELAGSIGNDIHAAGKSRAKTKKKVVRKAKSKIKKVRKNRAKRNSNSLGSLMSGF